VMVPSSRAYWVLAVVLLLLLEYASAQCELVTAGTKVEGQVSTLFPTQCFTFVKPPFTKELLMIDTATYDRREGYYVCTNVTGGAEGKGCSSQLRDQDQSICLSGIDGARVVTITVSCNQMNSLGCHTLQSGRFRMLVKWVFTPSECQNIMSFPLSAGVDVLSPSLFSLGASLLVLSLTVF
jgi:hypothetical protein